uniref:Telomerase reverse transcriptase n=3 Tax=Prorhinotermes simplex TaxID=1312446 RepID=A0A8B0M661_9NEOP|nr:telomerase reverse transcriptase isoform 1 [Prorhinotermes simplex]
MFRSCLTIFRVRCYRAVVFWVVTLCSLLTDCCCFEKATLSIFNQVLCWMNKDISHKHIRRRKKKIKPNVSTDSRIGYKGTTVLSNKQMLYNQATHEHWPSWHILAKSPTTLEGACKVLDHILSKDVGENISLSGRIIDLSNLKVLLLDFIKRHNSLSPYTYLLTHHLEGEYMNSTVDQQWQTARKLQPINHRLVSNFVNKIVRKVVPLGLFGCNHNVRLFKRMCSKLTCSGKFQNFRLDTLMSGLKTSNIPWLNSVTESAERVNIFAKVVLWLLEDFVMVLLRTHFSITEGLAQRNRLLFYRPQVHQHMTDRALSLLVKSKKLRVLDKEKAEKLEKTETFPGKAVMWFIPKKSGVRPVLLIRDRRRNAHKIALAQTYLTQAAALNPVSIQPLSANKLHKIWCTFFDHWNQNNRCPVYFVRTDISDAYGSLRHDKLCNILRNTILEDQTYTLKKYKLVCMKKRKLQYIYKKAFDHLPIVVPHNSALTGEEPTTVSCIVGSELLSFICKTLRNFVVHKGNQRFLMTCGQPQGGRLSAVLCDMYYSDLDRTHLREFQKDGDLLIRVVDDYLFITTDLDRAARFLKVMKGGFPEYGCSVNNKTQTNVPLEPGPVCTEVAYCGYVINTMVMHITGDYARYRFQDIAHSMRLTEVKCPGKYLQKRMEGSFSSLKLNVLVLDELYNSKDVVLTNVFYAGLLQAFRFHSLVKCTFDKKNLNQQFLTQIVYETVGRTGGHTLNIAKKYCKGNAPRKYRDRINLY